MRENLTSLLKTQVYFKLIKLLLFWLHGAAAAPKLPLLLTWTESKTRAHRGYLLWGGLWDGFRVCSRTGDTVSGGHRDRDRLKPAARAASAAPRAALLIGQEGGSGRPIRELIGQTVLMGTPALMSQSVLKDVVLLLVILLMSPCPHPHVLCPHLTLSSLYTDCPLCGHVQTVSSIMCCTLILFMICFVGSWCWSVHSVLHSEKNLLFIIIHVLNKNETSHFHHYPDLFKHIILNLLGLMQQVLYCWGGDKTQPHIMLLPPPCFMRRWCFQQVFNKLSIELMIKQTRLQQRWQRITHLLTV